MKNILCGNYDYVFNNNFEIFDEEESSKDVDDNYSQEFQDPVKKIYKPVYHSKASQDSETQTQQAYLHKVDKKSDDSSWGALVLGGLYAAAIIFSDKRLKEDIKKIGESPSGINIYTFRYKGKKELYRGMFLHFL